MAPVSTMGAPKIAPKIKVPSVVQFGTTIEVVDPLIPSSPHAEVQVSKSSFGGEKEIEKKDQKGHEKAPTEGPPQWVQQLRRRNRGEPLQ